MRYLRQLAVAAAGTAGMAAAALYGNNGGVCPHCEEIREDNKTNHKNYEYYEDYLKDKPADQQKDKGEVASSVNPPPPSREPSKGPWRSLRDVNDPDTNRPSPSNRPRH